MRKQNIENKFSLDIDKYIMGVEPFDQNNTTEYNELLKVGKFFANMDFSLESNKKTVYNTAKYNANNKGEIGMKKPFKLSKTAIAVFSIMCIIGVGLSQTSLAREMIKILKTITLGEHLVAMQVAPVQTQIDAENRLQKKSTTIIETNEDGTMTKISIGGDTKIDANVLVVKDTSELSKYLEFEATIPSYLPVGYKFDRAELYKDEDGTPSGKYVSLYFTKDNARDIFIQERIADNETGFGYATEGTVKEVNINGVKAALCDDNSLQWEVNGKLYVVTAHLQSENELIKIGESIK